MSVRIKTLQKIAQINNISLTKGNPTAVNVSMFPSVGLAWGSQNLALIQKIIDTLNKSIYQLTNGKIDFDKLRQQNFNVDTSSYDVVAEGMLNLSKTIYQKILSNEGLAYIQALNPSQKKAIVDGIKGSAALGTIPDGGINSILSNKIGGNFKTIILNSLANIK